MRPIEQTLLLPTYRLVPKWMILTCRSYRIKVMSTIASHSPSASEVIRHTCTCAIQIRLLLWISRKLGSKWPPIENGLRGIKWSRERWRQVTLKGQTRDSSTLTAQYLENSWRCTHCRESYQWEPDDRTRVSCDGRYGVWVDEFVIYIQNLRI